MVRVREKLIQLKFNLGRYLSAQEAVSFRLTEDDEICKGVRQKLGDLNTRKDVLMVFSNEDTQSKRKDQEDEGVMAAIPCVFGMSLAAYSLCKLAGQPFR